MGFGSGGDKFMCGKGEEDKQMGISGWVRVCIAYISFLIYKDSSESEQVEEINFYC